jgi:hypothetical protein
LRTGEDETKWFEGSEYDEKKGTREMMRLTINRVVGIRILAPGAVLALMVMAAGVVLAAQPAHAETTFTVNSTGDKNDLDFPGGVFDGSLDGECFTGSVLVVQGEECTLRAAIQQANKTTGADVIEFDIPGTGVATIAPASELPTITGPVTINGYSQPGARPNQKAVGSDAVLEIELSGASVQNGHGLVMGAANNTFKGLIINGWNQGVRIDGAGATGNRIAGNFIGTDASGTQGPGNGVSVRVYEGSSNTIGGTTPAARNVISGNGIGVGIGDGGPNTTANKVLGNYIGTDATGTKDLGNSHDGVYTEDTPDVTTNSIIGGATAAERNVISGNDESGVSLYGSGSKVLGNYIGTDATGTKDLGNSHDGVSIQGGKNNTVGGTQAGERNVISGNGYGGVAIQGSGTAGNRVLGNFIGTDKNGTVPLGNTLDGVSIVNAPNNTVGGATSRARNVISANKQAGVFIFGPDATGNKVIGNYVGTNASGTEDLGNYQGVDVRDASNTIIGGTTAGERNVISANDNNGVLIYGPNAKGNQVIGNYLGADKNGAALGNSANGVFINASSNNTVGGATAGARNVIAANAGGGVSIYGAGATGDRVLSNSIFSNGGLGIDLGDDGSTANDPDDLDAGPNNLQNFPVLSSAKKNAAGNTTVRGTLDSTPNATFRVEVFSNPKGADEGKTPLGSVIVSTNGAGDASFAFSTSKTVKLEQNITATATGPGGNTSEISAPKKVVAG